MRKTFQLIVVFFVLGLSSCGWQRIGDLTIMANRNIDSSKKYELIERNVRGQARIKKDDALERALDQATELHNGEYLANVKVYVKDNGKWMRVIGDVWGEKKTTLNIESSVTKNIEFNTGDSVTFSNGRRLIEAKIIGINPTTAIIELNGFRKIKKEISFEKLTKLER